MNNPRELSGKVQCLGHSHEMKHACLLLAQRISVPLGSWTGAPCPEGAEQFGSQGKARNIRGPLDRKQSRDKTQWPDRFMKWDGLKFQAALSLELPQPVKFRQAKLKLEGWVTCTGPHNHLWQGWEQDLGLRLPFQVVLRQDSATFLYLTCQSLFPGEEWICSQVADVHLCCQLGAGLGCG